MSSTTPKAPAPSASGSGGSRRFCRTVRRHSGLGNTTIPTIGRPSRLAEWITREIGRVDCLVGCVGSGGSLCGTGGFLREVFPDLSLIAVDTHRSILFGHAPGRRLLRGLGNSILPSNLRHEMIDEVHWVGALPAFAAARRLYHDHALFMGPTSGAAALVAAWYAREHPDATIVVILPDEGYRYQNTLYHDDWLTQLEGWPLDIPGEPVALRKTESHGEDSWTRLAWGRQSLAAIAAMGGPA
jgi:hypothetical protein